MMMMMMVRGAVNFDMVGRLKGIFYKGVYRTTEESRTTPRWLAPLPEPPRLST